MLGYVVGNVDSNAAIVLVAIVTGITLISAAALSRKRKLDYDIEAMKIKEDLEWKKYQVDQKLITSHRSGPNHEG